MKISLSQCQIRIRQRGLHSFGPCDNNGQEGKEVGGGGGWGRSSRPCDNDWRSHPDLVIMAKGLI